MPTPPRIALLAAALTTALTAQSHIVVPAAYATNDAMSYEWIAGATDLQRQQTLVGASHLQPLLNQTITAIELRRTAVDEAYLAGAANLTVTLSISPNTPLGCSNVFAANVGSSPQLAFAGTVTLPASPAVPGGTGAAVPWTPANTVRIALTQPFLYAGGTLCIDVTGQPIQGQETWWMADAIEDVIAGTAVSELGPGCGAYGGPLRQWSYIAERSLIPGGRAIFRAEGPPNGLVFAVFGGEATAPTFPNYPSLSQWGIPTPGCVSYVNPFAVLAVVPTIFEPETHPQSAIGALAEVLVQLPADPSWSGFTLTTQWYDLNQLAASNGFRWTVGSQPSALDMALCEGSPTLPVGNVTTYLAPVLRFEYQ